jgi:hypothetical protein
MEQFKLLDICIAQLNNLGYQFLSEKPVCQCCNKTARWQPLLVNKDDIKEWKKHNWDPEHKPNYLQNEIDYIKALPDSYECIKTIDMPYMQQLELTNTRYKFYEHGGCWDLSEFTRTCNGCNKWFCKEHEPKIRILNKHDNLITDYKSYAYCDDCFNTGKMRVCESCHNYCSKTSLWNSKKLGYTKKRCYNCFHDETDKCYNCKKIVEKNKIITTDYNKTKCYERDKNIFCESDQSNTSSYHDKNPGYRISTLITNHLKLLNVNPQLIHIINNKSTNFDDDNIQLKLEMCKAQLYHLGYTPFLEQPQCSKCHIKAKWQSFVINDEEIRKWQKCDWVKPYIETNYNELNESNHNNNAQIHHKELIDSFKYMQNINDTNDWCTREDHYGYAFQKYGGCWDLNGFYRTCNGCNEWFCETHKPKLYICNNPTSNRLEIIDPSKTLRPYMDIYRMFCTRCFQHSKKCDECHQICSPNTCTNMLFPNRILCPVCSQKYTRVCIDCKNLNFLK